MNTKANAKLVAAGIAVALLLPTVGGLQAQQGEGVKDKLIGSWALVSTRTTRTDGSVYGPYGPNEKGTLLFDSNGRFALILVNPDVPKYASNNREQPSQTEADAAAKGSFSFFGTYSVDEAERSFVFHIEASSFPNFNGSNQKRIIKEISADRLVFVNTTPPNSGGRAELIYRRLK
jgi:hypothetical protein